jgi:membrane-associated phospholipid phosphatase
VRAPEWVSLAFFGYLLVLARVHPAVKSRRLVITSACLTVGLLVALLPSLAFLVMPAMRDWLPLVYVLAGYKVSALFFVEPMIAIERRLADVDSRLFAAIGAPGLVDRAPRWLLEGLEAAYFVAPAMLAVGAFTLGTYQRSDLIEQYWTIVLLAEFGAFGMLPWIQTRAPWQVEPSGSMDRRALAARWMNQRIARPLSIQFNTFPSGHASGTVAVALGVMAAAPGIGALFLIGAVIVMTGAVLGRYHYAVDVVAGTAVAIAAALIVRS